MINNNVIATPKTAATLINKEISMYANENITINGNQRTLLSLMI